MGVTDFIESVKRWTAGQLDRTDKDDGQNGQKAKKFPNLGEDIQLVVRTPEFESVMNSASPFLLASLGAWPGYWLYRGFDYHSHRAHVPLPVYIRQVSIHSYINWYFNNATASRSLFRPFIRPKCCNLSLSWPV